MSVKSIAFPATTVGAVQWGRAGWMLSQRDLVETLGVWLAVLEAADAPKEAIETLASFKDQIVGLGK